VVPVHQHWEQRQWDVVGTLLDRVIPPLGSADCTLLADRGRVGHPLVQLGAQRGWHSIFRRSAAHTCQPARGRWARGWIPCRHLVPRRGRQCYGALRLWQDLAGAPTGCPQQCDLRARAAAAVDRPLRPARATAAGARVCAPYARRIAVSGPQTPRLGPARDGACGPSTPGSAAPGGLARSLVAGASGRLVRAAWAARPLRSPCSSRQGHLSPRTALATG
jgi:hypothetical protein